MGAASGNRSGRRLHQRLDAISGGFLLFLAVLAPWGAGGTSPWARDLLVVTGWMLGLLTLSQWGVERFAGFRPRRWRREPLCRWPSQLMGWTAGLLVLQIAISLWNWRAEATLTSSGVEFNYRDAFTWLPSTYDREATASALIRLIGFAGAFWAMRNWLSIRPEEDRRHGKSRGQRQVSNRAHAMIWVLSINAALMGMVGILQRLGHSHHLLWLVDLSESKTEAFFGSFPYRGNAAQYLNMIWPVGLGLWWDLRSRGKSANESRSGESPQPLLLLMSAITLAAAMMTGSRAGIGVALASAVIGVLSLGARIRATGPRLALAITFVAALGASWFFSGDLMRRRFENVFEDETLSGRTQIYQAAQKMAADFPFWGIGADSFMKVSFLYRKNAVSEWPGYVHNDWLETQVTLGWIGLALTVCLLSSAALCKGLSGSVPLGKGTVHLTSMGLLGVLAHAAIDFPFQIPSIQVTFLLLLALFSVSGTPSNPSRSGASDD